MSILSRLPFCFFFDIRFFQTIYEQLDEHYMVYGDFDEKEQFCLHLQCMDASANLELCLQKSRCSVFFSATLLPIHYYREQLAGREDDYAIYAPSPFSPKKRLLLIGRSVSTKYTQRGPQMYQRIADYIARFTGGKTGNYMVFFPSYQLLQTIQEYLLEKNRFCDSTAAPEEELPPNTAVLYAQTASMSESMREEFLSHFHDTPTRTTIGLCVLGGIFGEGIDLKENRLIGAAIVGTGLPMVCTERELFRKYFDRRSGAGFAYAYQYPGMNKVLQAAGRVIRTTRDIGAILLLDDRFLQSGYQQLFPREWFPYEVVTLDSLPQRLRQFWDSQPES